MASSSISKSVIWQLIGKFSVQGLAFFTAPIFTRLLSPTDYGYTSIYASWSALLCLFIGVQSHGSINNARVKYNESEINGYLSSIMSVSILVFVFFFLLSFLLEKPLSNFLGFRRDIYILLFITSFFSFVISFYTAKLDSYKEVEKSCFLSLGFSITTIIISLLFVYNCKTEKYIAKLYAQAIPCIVFGLFILGSIYIKGRKVWNSEYIKFCLIFSLPMVIHTLGHLIFSQSDRIMLQKMQDEAVVGIYGITYTLCNILNILVDSINVSWVPFYYDFKRKNDEKTILLHSKRYIKLISLVFIGFHLLSYDVFKLLAPEVYWEGMTIIPLFVISFFFTFLYLFPVNYEFYNCKTKIIPVITFSVAIVNIIINYMLIPKYGFIGAAIGTTIAHVFLFIFHQLVAKLLIKKDYEYKMSNFLLWIFIVVLATILIPLIKNLLAIRWIIAVFIGSYLFYDILKNRSIF